MTQDSSAGMPLVEGAPDRRDEPPRSRIFPPARWLAEYRAAWLGADVIAGVTLAAYAIPVSLAYATLAGLPPQVGVYGYLLGGLGYALFGSSRQLAIGPTSAISLMIAGTVGAMAEGDAQRYAQIASLAAFTVAVLCLLSWLLRLSALVKLISDSILVGFKIGAGLTIAMTQLPSLFGIAGGGHNFFERVALLAMQIGQMKCLVLAVGLGSRSLCCCSASGCCRGGPSRSPSLLSRSLPQPCLGYPRSGCRRRERFRPACPHWLPRRCACATWRGLFRSPPGVCCSPMWRASPPRAALPPSTAMRSTRDRNSSASAPQISRPRSGRAIRWRADCRNRR